MFDRYLSNIDQVNVKHMCVWKAVYLKALSVYTQESYHLNDYPVLKLRIDFK